MNSASRPVTQARARLRRPFLAAAACLAGGFATLAVLSLVTGAAPDGRSMWSYWGGTLGDLMLPVIVYGLTRACTALGPQRVSVGSYAGAGLGAVTGIGSQAAWLFDPDPRVNWLVVAPHTFSAAGWYHAGYLTLTSAYVGGVSWEALRRMGPAPRDRLKPVLPRPGTAVTLAACGIFVLTIVADSLASAATSSSQVTIAIIVSVPVLLLTLAAWRLGHAIVLLFQPLAFALAITGIGVLIITASKVAPR